MVIDNGQMKLLELVSTLLREEVAKRFPGTLNEHALRGSSAGHGRKDFGVS